MHRFIALMLILLVSGCVGVANNAPLVTVPFCPDFGHGNQDHPFFQQCDVLHLEYDI